MFTRKEQEFHHPHHLSDCYCLVALSIKPYFVELPSIQPISVTTAFNRPLRIMISGEPLLNAAPMAWRVLYEKRSSFEIA